MYYIRRRRRRIWVWQHYVYINDVCFALMDSIWFTASGVAFCIFKFCYSIGLLISTTILNSAVPYTISVILQDKTLPCPFITNGDVWIIFGIWQKKHRLSNNASISHYTPYLQTFKYDNNYVLYRTLLFVCSFKIMLLQHKYYIINNNVSYRTLENTSHLPLIHLP